MSQGSSNKKVANSLVAMSSAAILAVYSAGYTRTRAAAERLDTQSTDRRQAPAPPRPAHVPEAPAVPVPAVADAPAPRPAPAAPVAKVKPAPEPKLVAETILPAAEPAIARNPEPKPVEAAPTGPTAPVTPPPAPVTPAAPTPAPPAPTAPPPAAPTWKDGTYLGWGTSRHGDIQASVVVENGRILSATIAQCLTRYSCSVISNLPPQVAQRQSPEVDFVSGATQSANAFYYGVVDALNKAK